MNDKSTLILKVTIIMIGMPVLAISLIGVYLLIQNPVNPKYAYLIYPILFVLYSSTIPFYIASYKAFKLLSYIDQGIPFSEKSHKALKHIKYCTSSFCLLYVLVLPIIFQLAQMDDAPGLVIVGMMPIFVAFILTVYTAVLQKLFSVPETNNTP